MADSSVDLASATGLVDTRTESTNSNHRQVVVIGDPSSNAGVAPVDGTTGLAVNVVAGGAASGTAGTASSDVLSVQGIASMTPVQVAGAVAHDAVDSGAPQKIGGYAKAAAPTNVSADADRVNAWFLLNGSQTVTVTCGGALVGGDATNGLDVDLTRIASGAVNSGAFASGSIASGAVASGAFASGSIGSGAVASGAFASGALASGAVASGAFASGSIAAGAVAAGAASFVKNEDAASADGDAGVPAMMRRTLAPANTSGADFDYEMLQGSGGYLWVHDNKGLSNLAFSADFSTLTRPANTTAYTAGDSISNNATAGSVTALSATVSDVNDDPIFISEIVVNSTDTGLAGKKLRAYLFNSDPTASTGVGGGDNAAYSQKKAGYIGSFMGWMETGFSDGTVGRLVPAFNETNNSPAGGFVVAKPTSGARTLYIQYQAVEAFTPSANSTTVIGTAKGWQGRAV